MCRYLVCVSEIFYFRNTHNIHEISLLKHYKDLHIKWENSSKEELPDSVLQCLLSIMLFRCLSRKFRSNDHVMFSTFLRRHVECHRIFSFHFLSFCLQPQSFKSAKCIHIVRFQSWCWHTHNTHANSFKSPKNKSKIRLKQNTSFYRFSMPLVLTRLFYINKRIYHIIMSVQ